MTNVSISNGRINHSRITWKPNSIGINTAVERNLNAIDRIVVHHTVSGNMPTIENVNNWWRGRGWSRSGYHLLIRNDGSIWQLVPIHAPSWGAGPQANPRSIHISLAGNFTATNLPSTAAKNSFAWLVNQLLDTSALANLQHATHVTRHSEWMATLCSGFTTTQFRQWVADARHSPSPELFQIRIRTGGFFTAADAAANRNRRTWVEPGIYHIFNRSQGMINLTARQGIPGSWINPNSQEASLGQTISVGSRVRVNNNATNWATGETIPSWVRGQIYTVLQLRNNNNELLLTNVISWIRHNDVTLV